MIGARLKVSFCQTRSRIAVRMTTMNRNWSLQTHHHHSRQVRQEHGITGRKRKVKRFPFDVSRRDYRVGKINKFNALLVSSTNTRSRPSTELLRARIFSQNRFPQAVLPDQAGTYHCSHWCKKPTSLSHRPACRMTTKLGKKPDKEHMVHSRTFDLRS